MRGGQFDTPHRPESEWVFVDSLDDAYLRREEEKARALFESSERSLVASPPVAAPQGYGGSYYWAIKMMTEPEYCLDYMMAAAEAAAQCFDQYLQAVGRIRGRGGDQRARLWHPGPRDVSPRAVSRIFCAVLEGGHGRHPSLSRASKTWIHCCGSVPNMVPYFIEAGVDCLNPVQWTAGGWTSVAQRDLWRSARLLGRRDLDAAHLSLWQPGGRGPRGARGAGRAEPGRGICGESDPQHPARGAGGEYRGVVSDGAGVSLWKTREGVRPVNIRVCTPEDYAAVVGVHNLVHPERPITIEGLVEGDRRRDPKYRHQRWVALQEARVVGFCVYGQQVDDYHPNKFHVDLAVLPDYRRRGIGSALYDQLAAGLAPFEPQKLRADGYGNMPEGVRFLQQRGFQEVFRETPLHLEVLAFDPGPYAGLEEELRAQGIEIQTLRDLEGDPDRDRKVYDLYWEMEADVPREDEPHPIAFGEWVKWTMKNPHGVPRGLYHRRLWGRVHRDRRVWPASGKRHAVWGPGRRQAGLSEERGGPGHAGAGDRLCPCTGASADSDQHGDRQRWDARAVRAAGLCAAAGLDPDGKGV